MFSSLCEQETAQGLWSPELGTGESPSGVTRPCPLSRAGGSKGQPGAGLVLDLSPTRAVPGSLTPPSALTRLPEHPLLFHASPGPFRSQDVSSSHEGIPLFPHPPPTLQTQLFSSGILVFCGLILIFPALNTPRAGALLIRGSASWLLLCCILRDIPLYFIKVYNPPALFADRLLLGSSKICHSPPLNAHPALSHP